MKVITIRDTETNQFSNYVLPEGTVLQDVRENKHTYRGLFTSMWGSYFVTVSKEDCEVVDENEIPLIERLINAHKKGFKYD